MKPRFKLRENKLKIVKKKKTTQKRKKKAMPMKETRAQKSLTEW